MHPSHRLPARTVLLAATALTIAGCFDAPLPSAASDRAKGQLGQHFMVNTFWPPVGGTITSSESPTPRINCGAASQGSPKADDNGVLQYQWQYYPGADRCGVKGQTQYAWDEEVVLTATPAAGYVFYSWAGDCSGTGTCTLGAGPDRTVVAVFRSGATWRISLINRGSGSGVVSLDLPGQPTETCGPGLVQCTFHVPATTPATVATLTVQPDAASHFVGWAGACSGPGACALAVDGDKDLYAELDFNALDGQVVDSGGGLVTSATGVTILVPPGAVDAATTFAVTETTTTLELPANVVPDSPVYHFEPAGQVFAMPLTVRIPAPPGVASACTWWQQHVAALYECVGGTITADGYVEAQVSHFSDAFIGTASATHTVQGTRFNTHLAGATTIANSPDGLELDVVAAWVRDGSGAYARLQGQGYADGTFRIPGVPDGASAVVQVGAQPSSIVQLVDTAATDLDLGQVLNGLPGLSEIGPTDRMPIDLTIDGLAPYIAGDEIDVISPLANTWAMGVEGVGLPAGSTSLRVTDLKAARGFVLPANVIDGTRAPTLVIQLSRGQGPTSFGWSYMAFRRFGKITGLDIGPFVPPVPAQVTLEDVPQSRTVSVDWNVPPYVDVVRQTGATTCSTVNFQVQGQAGSLMYGVAPAYAVKKRSYLNSWLPADVGRLSTGPMAFGWNEESEQDWSLFWEALVSCTRQVLTPWNTPHTIYSQYAKFESYVPQGVVSLQEPDLSPPLDVRIDGLPLSTPQTGVSDRPVISWEPPAIGTPTLYTITVDHLIAGTRWEERVAVLHTAGTSFAIPPGFLVKGETYAIVVIASSGGRRPEMTMRMALPYTRANYGAAWFTVGWE